LGCVESKTPVSDPEKAKVDQRLLGVWRTKGEDGSVTYYHIGLAGGKLPNGILRAWTITHRKDGTLETIMGGIMSSFLFSSEVGKSQFLNVVAVSGIPEVLKMERSGWKSKVVESYYIAKYQIEGDTLTLESPNYKVLQKAIQIGKIKGHIQENDIDDVAVLTDTSEDLARFLTDSENAKLFSDKTSYQRVK
jgi:hypothetical protein